MVSRTDYQAQRLELLSAAVDLNNTLGLEIGACDLPTVGTGAGNCRFADFRSAEQMAHEWSLSPETVCHVDYLLSRDQAPHEQVTDRFDYIIACQVLEHVPDPISYLQSLRSLLKDGPGKVIFIGLPDKRDTLDATRASTTIEQLLGYYFEKLTKPTFAQILEFHRHWLGHANGGTKPLPIKEAYAYAAEYVRSDEADAHCHVWEDREFRDQIEELIGGGMLKRLNLSRYVPMYEGMIEFAVILTTT